MTGRGERLAFALALAVVAACHAPSLTFDFLAWDDRGHVTKNPLVIAPATVSWRESLTTPDLGYPIPVTVASYRVNAVFSGVTQAWPFHLGNVMLHVACAAFLFVLARAGGLSRDAATMVVLVYGLHPVVAEPVSWISGRKDLLAGFFALATLWLALPSPARWRRMASLACYALALLSKPSAAPVCLFVPFLAHWFPTAASGGERSAKRLDVRRAARSLAPFLLVLAPVLVLGVIGQRAVGVIADADREGASWARTLSYGLGHHAALLWMWEEPTAKYVPNPWPPGFVPHIDLAPLVFVGAAAFAHWRMTGAPRRVAGFALLWSALTYLPSSGVISLNRQFADSYVYLPLMGLAWFAGALVDSVAGRARGRAQAVVAWAPWVVGALLALRVVPSAARFHDDEALWAHTRARFPHSARVCRQWANGVTTVRGSVGGLEATDACIAQFGDELFVKNRGVLLFQVGRRDAARPWLVRARAASPNDPIVEHYLRALDGAPAAARPYTPP